MPISAPGSSLHCLVSVGVCLFLLPFTLHGGDQPFSMTGWVPPSATQWTSLGNRLGEAIEQASKKKPIPSPGAYKAPLVGVDRTNGRLYAFPQTGALWVSDDRGQTFEWLNREVPNWGFNESPTSMCVHPEGKKIRIFSSNRNGFSLDAGKTWKYMNFKINYGFEDGVINWDGTGDGKMIVARSHTWPKPRMWLSRDAGESFVEYPEDITQQINTQSMALMDGDVLLFQGDKLMRTEDYGKTLTEVPLPAYTYVGANGKTGAGRFAGLSRRFKDKVYWLNGSGIYTSADKGLTWTVVGATFPADMLRQVSVRSGPLFGKDEKHMLVLCLDRVIETLDGGQNWHVLAELPVKLNDHPWAHSFGYDPIGDILYCNDRGHAGGPYLFGRLALKRWGDVEKVPPSAPTGIQANIVRAGNCVDLRWKASGDASGIYSYYIYVDGILQYRTEVPEIVLSNCSWNQELKVGVQAVDAWQNRSAVVEQVVRTGAKPARATLLKDLQSTIATFDGAPMDIVTDAATVADKAASALTFHVDGYEPNPVSRRASMPVPYGLGVRVKKSQKQGILEYALDRKYTRLMLDVGMRGGGWDRVGLKILLDGKQVAETKVDREQIDGGQKPEVIDLDLTNVKVLRFEFAGLKNPYWQVETVILGNAVLFAGK